jgi:hypothetical protein
MAVPGAAEHAELRRHLRDLAAQREKLKLGEAEFLASQAASQAQFAKVEQAARDNEEALRQRKEAFGSPVTSLDGDALGRKLMK